MIEEEYSELLRESEDPYLDEVWDSIYYLKPKPTRSKNEVRVAS